MENNYNKDNPIEYSFRKWLWVSKIIILMIGICLIIGGCAKRYTVNGWYPVSDNPAHRIEGKAIVTTADFEAVSLDTVSVPGMAMIEGKLKADKVRVWADATEARIGKRIGFVYNDSVIMAPTINCRIESGRFTINSPDKTLIIGAYNSLKENQ